MNVLMICIQLASRCLHLWELMLGLSLFMFVSQTALGLV